MDGEDGFEDTYIKFDQQDVDLILKQLLDIDSQPFSTLFAVKGLRKILAAGQDSTVSMVIQKASPKVEKRLANILRDD